MNSFGSHTTSNRRPEFRKYVELGPKYQLVDIVVLGYISFYQKIRIFLPKRYTLLYSPQI